MRSHPALLLLLSVGIGAAALWLALGRSSAAPPADAATLPGAMDRAPAEDPDARDARSPVPSTAGVERTAVAPEVPQQQPLMVRVVGADGMTVPGATVRYRFPHDTPDVLTDESHRLSESDVERWLARFGAEATTGADGTATIAVPPPPDSGLPLWFRMCARANQRFTSDWVDWRKAAGLTLELRLALDESFDVKLVDERGEAVAGVPIEARFTALDEHFGEVRGRERLGVTDAAGLVHAAHVQIWRDWVVRVGSARRARIGPGLPGCAPVGTEIDLDRLPAEPVLVTMPETGRIVVVCDEWPQPADGWQPGVRLEPVREESAFGQTDGGRAEIDPDGRAEFARVALGLRWAVERETWLGREEFDGPRTPGEEVVVRIAAPPHPVLVGRLLEDGAPLASTSFLIAADRGGDGHDLLTDDETDADGRFASDIAPRHAGTEPELCFVAKGADGAGNLVGSVVLPHALVLGRNDVGDVALSAKPPLLEGRVVGEPDADSTYLWVEQSDGGAPFRGAGDLPLDLRPDRTFAVRGKAPAGAALRLRVVSPEHLPVAPIPFVAGQRDLVVRLERGGNLELPVIVGDYRAEVSLEVRLAPSDGRPQAVLSGSDPRDRQIENWDRALPRWSYLADDPITLGYKWRGLPPGKYRVEIFAWGSERPVAEVPGVEVETDRTTNLDPIDVRERVRYLRLRFPALERLRRDERQLAAGLTAYGYVFVDEGGGSLADHCFSVDSAVMFFAAPAAVDLVVDMFGFRRKVLRGVRRNLDVELEPGYPVELTLEPAPSLPDGAAVELWLTPGAGAALPAGAIVMSPAAGGSVMPYAPVAQRCARDGAAHSIRVTTPGRYELEARLRFATGRTEPCDVVPDHVQVLADGARAAVAVSVR